MIPGIELITKERSEHSDIHGRTIEKDVQENSNYQLASGAALLTYINPDEVDATASENNNEYDFSHCCPYGWSQEMWHKMMNKPYKERLIISGSLIAAEIDRLQAFEGQPTLTQG